MDWKKIVVGGVIAILAVLLVLSFVSYESKVADIKTLETDLKDASATNDLNTAAIENLNKAVKGLNEKVSTLEAEKVDLANKLTEALKEPETPVEPEVPTEVKPETYKEDDLKIGSDVDTITLSDRKLSKLFDGTVLFDGDDYDVEELVIFAGLKIANDDEDYSGEAFLTVTEPGIEYKVIFDDDLVLEDIGEDDNYLNINFLGQPMEITGWNGTEITVRRGAEYTLKEGESIIIDGKELLVLFVGDNGKAEIAFDGIAEVFTEGQTRNFNGVDVFLSEVLYNSRMGMVTVRVGNDVKETYRSKEEFVEDSIWNWVITDNSLGVILGEEFVGFDAEEDFNALAYGKTLGLPYDYVVMKFDGLSTEDMTNIKVDKSGAYTRLTGKFEYDLETYTKLYFNGSELLDQDKNALGLTITVVDIEDSDYELEVCDEFLCVNTKDTDDNLLKFNIDTFDGAYFDTAPMDEDESYINSVGMRVKAFDFEDKKFEFSVPEKAVTATLSFTLG